MIYCGIHEYTDWRDSTTTLVHEWVRATFTEPFGFKFETYTFRTFRKCLPLPEESK